MLASLFQGEISVTESINVHSDLLHVPTFRLAVLIFIYLLICTLWDTPNIIVFIFTGLD